VEASPQRRRHRSAGIIAVEIVLYLGAIVELVAGVAILASVFVSPDQDRDFRIFEVFVASLLILVALFNSFLAHAIGRGKEWGRAIYVILQLLTILGGIAGLADGQTGAVGFIVVPLVLILLLFTPSSLRYFAEND